MDQVPTTPTDDELPDNRQLAREITLLSGQINAANHRLLQLIAPFDRNKGWNEDGSVRSCAHWLNWKCGIGLGAAREKIRVAHCLEDLPLIDAAFAVGEISYSKVRAMTRVATPENEDYLLMIARHGTASQLEKVIAKYRAVQRSMESKAEVVQFAARELVYFRDDNGMWVIHARLPAEAGELVVKAIDAAMEAAEEAGADEEISRKDVSAETPKDVLRENPTFPQKRADALANIVEHYLASGPRMRSLKGGDRCMVELHVSLAALQAATDSPAHGMCCDAGVVTVLKDEKGDLLNIGRRSRTVPAHIRRALAIRDNGTCQAPGCCATRYTDAHHVVHWAHGGETSLDNLITLCRHHHRALHQGEFTVAAEERGAQRCFVFRNAKGQVLQESIYPQFPRTCAETFPRKLQILAPDVTPDTCSPYWTGERCDYSMAVDGLLRRGDFLSQTSPQRRF